MDEQEQRRQLARAAKVSQGMNIWLALGALVGLIGLPILGWFVLPHDGVMLLVIFLVLPVAGVVIGQRLMLMLIAR